MVTYETSRPVSTPGRPHRRGGFALLRNLLEVLLTWIVVWSLILIIPSILETAIHQSSVTDVSAQDPILKLEVTSEGQELWIQRGPSELVSMDLATRKTRHIYRNKGRALTHWDVSEDGATYLLSIDEREVMVIRQDELIISEPLSGFSSLLTALSANGRTAIRICGGTSVRCWDLSSDEPVISDYSLSNVADKIAVDASGDRLAISGMSSGLYLCEAKTGRCIRTISNQCTPSKAPVFSRDGKWLMAANGIQISLYHVDTGKIVWRTGIPSSDPFFSIAFSPDGEWIAASGVRSGILIFHRIDGKLHRQLPSVSSLHRIAFSSANDTLYSGSTDGSIHFWSLSAGRQMQILKLLEEG